MLLLPLGWEALAGNISLRFYFVIDVLSAVHLLSRGVFSPRGVMGFIVLSICRSCNAVVNSRLGGPRVPLFFF